MISLSWRLMAATVSVLALTAPAAAAAPPTTVDTGLHQLTTRLTESGIDLGIWHNAGTSSVPGAGGSVIHDVAEIAVHLTGDAVYPIPTDAGWRIFGPSGADAYETGLPPTANGVALGFNSNLIPREQLSTVIATRNITFKIVEARGPGRAMISPRGNTLQTNTAGTPPSPLTSTFDPALPGYTQRGAISGSVPFQFNNVGVYCLGLQASAFLPDQTPVSSAVETLRIVVGDWETWGDKDCGAGPQLPANHYDVDAVNHWDAATNKLLPVAHVDLAPYLNESGHFEAGLHETSQDWDRWWNLANTVVFVPNTAKVTIPEPIAGADFSFLGEPGTQIWRVPASAAGSTGTPALGYSGEEFEADDFAGRPQWRLDAVTALNGTAAPGDYFLGTNEPEAYTGGSPHFSTRQGLPQSRGIRSGSHVHANWDFTAAGTYCLSMRFSGRPAGKDYTTVTDRVLTVVVGGNAYDPTTAKTCEQARHDDDVTFPSGTPSSAPVVAEPGRTVVAPPDPTRQTFAVLAPRLGDAGLDVPLVHGSQTTGGKTHDIDDVILHVVTPYAVSDPELTPAWGSAKRYGLLGAFGSVALSLSTLDPTLVDLDGPLHWALGAVRGPGQLDFASPDVPLRLSTVPSLASSAGLVRPDTTVDGAWRFETAGVYCVPMTWSGTTADGQEMSVTKTLAIAAGVSADGVQPGPGCVASSGGGPGPDPGPSNPVPGSGRTVLSAGHVDITSTLNTDGLIQTVDDRAIDTTTLYVAAGAERTIPGDYAFLGDSGAPAWVLPESQDEALLWPGWTLRGGTRPLNGGESVTWTLGEIRGPGRFVLYQNDSFGRPLPRLSSADADTRAFSFTGHGHGNWAFTADGAYCIPITAKETVTGHTASFTLLFAVGALEPAAITPADCGRSATEINARPRAGDPEPAPSVQSQSQSQSQLEVRPRPRAASITVRTKVQRVGRTRIATLATLRCPSACGIGAPKHVRVRIGGKSYRLALLAPRSVKAGGRASIRLRLPRAATRRLAGRRATVRTKVTITSADRTTTRTIKVRISR